MELLNATGMFAGYTMGLDKEAREHLVVAVKGTFVLPRAGAQPELAEVQLPLVEADEFTGEPGLSAPLYESDYAPRKPRCDILLNGSAYAPGGKPTTAVQVGMQVGSVTKVFNVVGDRYWYTATGGIGATRPQPFETMPVSYDRAFGGVDDFHPDESKRDAYLPNPAGRGFHAFLSNELVHNTPLPNTEESDRTVSSPAGNYKPMSFGSVGRGWQARAKLAGTYDQQWIDEVFPFLPADFDEAYFQSAPPDQQCAYLKGGETVQLLNLTPQGRTSFQLPVINVPVVFFRKKGGREETQAVIDTLLLEPDKRRFHLVWRASLPLKKNMFEIPQVLVGRKTRAWWRARDLGKDYYPSLDHLIRSSRAVEEEEE